MGQQIVGGSRGPSGCGPLLGILCVGIVCATLLYLDWTYWSAP